MVSHYLRSSLKYSVKLIATITVIVLMYSGLRAQSTFNMVFNNSIEQGWSTIGGGFGQNVLEIDNGFLIYGLQVSENSFSKSVTTFIDTQGQYVSQTEIRPTILDTNNSFGSKRSFDSKNQDPIVLVTVFEDMPSPFAQVHLAKLTSTGDTVWMNPIIDTGFYSISYSLETTNNLIAGAGFEEPNSGSTRCFFILCDTLGSIVTTNDFQTEGWLHGITETTDGGFLLTGLDNNDPEKGLLIRTDNLGNELWRRKFGGRSASFIAPCIEFPNGDIVVSSPWAEIGNPLGPTWLQFKKWTGAGDFIYDVKPFGSSTWGHAAGDLIATSDGGYLGAGMLGLVGQSPVFRGVVFKMDSVGNLDWSREHIYYSGGTALNWFYDIDTTSDGGLILTGESKQGGGDPFPGLQMTWVVKSDSLGCVVPGCHLVGIEEQKNEALQVFPNPFTNEIFVEAIVESVELYDMTGRLVRSIDGNRLTGLEDLPPALYIVKAGNLFARVIKE